MVFKRRESRSLFRLFREGIYPRGGWTRAAHYVKHRVRRLPDDPRRIARGIFAGVFISFTPLFGFHFLGAALIAWALRGNILAALLATFVGNPLTTPLIAISSVEFGHWILGVDMPLEVGAIVNAFAQAGVEIWDNLRAIFTSDRTEWHRLSTFFHLIFLPYLVGGILPGLAVSLVFYWVSIPVIAAYQKIHAAKTAERQRKRALAGEPPPKPRGGGPAAKPGAAPLTDGHRAAERGDAGRGTP